MPGLNGIGHPVVAQGLQVPHLHKRIVSLAFLREASPGLLEERDDLLIKVDQEKVRPRHMPTCF